MTTAEYVFFVVLIVIMLLYLIFGIGPHDDRRDKPQKPIEYGKADPKEWMKHKNHEKK